MADACAVESGAPTQNILNSLQKSFRHSKLTDQENARRISAVSETSSSQSVNVLLLDWHALEKDDTQSRRAITHLSQIVKAEALKVKEKAEADGGSSRHRVRRLLALVGRVWQSSKISNARSSCAVSLISMPSSSHRAASSRVPTVRGTYAQGCCSRTTRGFITACAPWPTIGGRGARFKRFLDGSTARIPRLISSCSGGSATALPASRTSTKWSFQWASRQRQGHDNGDPELRAGDGYYSRLPELLTLESREPNRS